MTVRPSVTTYHRLTERGDEGGGLDAEGLGQSAVVADVHVHRAEHEGGARAGILRAGERGRHLGELGLVATAERAPLDGERHHHLRERERRGAVRVTRAR